MRIETKFMRFNNHWTISSSYDFLAHQLRSHRGCFFQTALLWFEVLPDLSLGLHGLSWLHRELSPAHSDSSAVHPDLSPVYDILLPVLPDLLLALPCAPRWTQSSLTRSEVFPNLLKSLRLCTCTRHQRFQLLRRLARIPFYGPILSCNWRI